MAAENSTANLNGLFKYHEYLWGDLICGTKGQLQVIGIGVGLAFPGEIGGPQKKLNTVDPRGFKCVVKHARGEADGLFEAWITFPEREQLFGFSDWEPFAPGVQRKAMYWTDDFLGSADDLVSAGLVPAGFFPGLPGMRKTRVIILPDDSLFTGSPTANYGRRPGTKRVEKASGGKYHVEIRIPHDLGELRAEECRRRDAQWAAKIMALPRPPRVDGPLRATRNQEATASRSALRLVWSKPSFAPGFNSLPPGPFAR